MMSSSLRHRLSQILIALGLMLLAMAVLIDKVGLAEGAGRARILLGLLSALLIFGGVLGKRFASAYQGLAVIGLNTIVVLICLELGATAYNHITWRPPARDLQNSFLPADEDAVAILREIHEATFDPKLYVGWMNRPYTGQTLTIRPDGLRHTPGAVCEAGAFHIFAFGGSTMWGEGAPDAGTIPAYLQKFLAPELDRPLCVTNYGQRAWVSTQNLVKLIIELQHGRVPDAVVFYDGYNDVFAGYATGRVGVPENFLQLAEFKQEYRGGKKALIQLAKKTQLGQLVTNLVTPVSKDTRTIDAAHLSDQIVGVYLQVLQMTKALADAYGFAYQFYWQPQLAAGTKPLSPGERTMLEQHRWLPQPVRDLTSTVYTHIGGLAQTQDDLVDLSGAFAEVPERVYIDPAHITSTGNRVVAQAMLDAGLRQLVMDKAAGRFNSKMQTVTRNREAIEPR